MEGSSEVTEPIATPTSLRSTGDVSISLGVNARTVRWWCHKHKLGVKVGGHLVLTEEDVQALIKLAGKSERIHIAVKE